MRERLLLLAAALVAAPAGATTVADATGDYLASFTGTPNAALDIVSATASYDGTNFLFGATVNGTIGLAGSLYVFGINRGAGTARLALGTPSIGATVLWDAAAILFPDGTGRIVTFPAAGAPVITTLPGVAIVSGNTISGTFSAALLSSTGFAPADYTVTLWSRLRVNPAADGTNAEIADFAPNAGGFAVGVPEPGAWALMTAGFGAMGVALRTRRRRRAEMLV